MEKLDNTHPTGEKLASNRSKRETSKNNDVSPNQKASTTLYRKTSTRLRLAFSNYLYVKRNDLLSYTILRGMWL